MARFTLPLWLPSMMSVLLTGMVTDGALFQLPGPYQLRLPLMTVLPTRLPLLSYTLVPVTVPLRLKLPTLKARLPLLFVAVPPVKLPPPCSTRLPCCTSTCPADWLNTTPWKRVWLVLVPADLRKIP